MLNELAVYESLRIRKLVQGSGISDGKSSKKKANDKLALEMGRKFT